MEKLKLKTEDLTKENIEKLGSLFPEILTEVKNEDGEIIKTIDAEKLKELVGDFADKDSEIYQLTWAGKQNARRVATEPTTKTLKPDIKDSEDFENTENLYIEGDNLEVLKILRKSYTNSIKMIYIDPPYNTGKDFVYKDKFARSKQDEDIESGAVDEEGNRLIKNTGIDGRYHSNWLNMMYPRLQLAHKLLKKDGVIFISIDDNEVDNLRKIMDEIFGESNFVGTITWLKKRKGSFLSKKIISLTEYCLVYSKSEEIKLFGGKPSSNESQPIVKRTNSIGELTFPKNIIKTKLSDGIYKAGKYGSGTSSIELLTNTKVKNNLFISNLKIKGPFTWSQKNLNKEIEKGTEIIINTNSFQVRIFKKYSEDDFKGLPSVIKGIELNATTESGYEELISIFNKEKILDYPKPINLIKYLVNSSTYFGKNSTILDFFSGSATTAHAVMQLNAEDNRNRKYIMVQLPEEIEEGTEAYKAGYKNICEIGKERIRRAAKKIQEDNKDKDLSNMDFGFRVFKLSDSIYKDTILHPGKVSQENLKDFEESIKSGTPEEDVLYSVLISMGIPISAKVEIKTINDKKVFVVSDGLLVACFDKNIDLDLVKELAKIKTSVDKLKPRFVFKESSIKGDSEMMGIMDYLRSQVFKTKEDLKDNVKVI